MPSVAGDGVAVERVHRPLAGRENVRMAGLEREAPPGAVVEEDARTVHEAAGAEGRRERVDERDGIPFLIHRAEGGRIGHHFRDEREGGVIHAGVGGINRDKVRCAAFRANQFVEREVDEVRIARIAVAIREGEFFRLDHQVERRRAMRVHPGEISIGEDVQLLQQNQALARVARSCRRCDRDRSC